MTFERKSKKYYFDHSFFCKSAPLFWQKTNWLFLEYLVFVSLLHYFPRQKALFSANTTVSYLSDTTTTEAKAQLNSVNIKNPYYLSDIPSMWHNKIKRVINTPQKWMKCFSILYSEVSAHPRAGHLANKIDEFVLADNLCCRRIRNKGHETTMHARQEDTRAPLPSSQYLHLSRAFKRTNEIKRLPSP